MPTRKGSAVWNGALKGGKGSVKLGSGVFEGNYSFSSRFKEGEGTNPEELIGAAHAGCFSMALAHELAEAGYSPQRVATEAKVNLVKTEGGFEISGITLETEAQVGGIEEEIFHEQAENAKNNCPVSKALAGVKINLQANLID